MTPLEASDSIKEDHQARSNFVRGLVQRSREPEVASSAFCKKPPKRIVQFWNNPEQLPGDVRECIESWRKTEEEGFELILFDERQAKEFIRGNLDSRYEKAYDKEIEIGDRLRFSHQEKPWSVPDFVPDFGLVTEFKHSVLNNAA